MPQFSIWEKDSFFTRQDVIIIGCGFTGLWSALYLKTLFPHYTITIIEKDIVPNGASTRNAGFSCFGSPTELLKDSAVMGNDKMLDLVEMRYKGLAEIRKNFKDALIGYENCGGYECFDNSIKGNELAEKIQQLNKAIASITNIPDTFSLCDKKINQLGLSGFSHLVENKLEGVLHPGKLVKALLQKIQELQVQVLTGTTVINYSENNKSVLVQTEHFTMEAKQLLMCTNAYTAALLPGIDIQPARGQILLTSPIEGLLLKGAFHYDEGFYYFRNIGNRVLLGGGRNKALKTEATTENAITEQLQNELENFLAKHILQKKKYHITNRWCGIMAMGAEKHPLVKAISNKVFCCVRLSGMGVALAPIVTQKVVQLMQEATN